MIHELPLERRTLHGHFSRDLEPIVEIDAGDSVAFACLNAGWRYEDETQFEPRDAELDDGHALVGPVAVRGARAGQTLAVRVDEVRPARWGMTFADGSFFDWDISGNRATARGGWVGASLELRPFLGVMGMPPPEPGVHSTAPPRQWGGNIDCKELVAGTTLFLPIPVDGALFSAGDGHGCQGDGEVSGTAIECPVERAVLTLDLAEDLELAWPVARGRGTWIAFGFDENLDIAADIALEGMLALMDRELDLRRPHALALASLVVDLRVTQLVNGVKGVHAVLRDDALR